MEKNKKFIPIIKDQEQGTWAYRGPGNEKETRIRYQKLRSRGIEAENIDIVPVRESGLSFSDILSVLNIACTIVEVWLFFKGNNKKKK